MDFIVAVNFLQLQCKTLLVSDKEKMYFTFVVFVDQKAFIKWFHGTSHMIWCLKIFFYF